MVSLLRVLGTNSLAYLVCSGGGYCCDGGCYEARRCEESLCMHGDLQVNRSKRKWDLKG